MDVRVYVVVAAGVTVSEPEQLDAPHEYEGRTPLMNTRCTSAVVVVNDSTLDWPAAIVDGVAVNVHDAGALTVTVTLIAGCGVPAAVCEVSV